MRAVLIILLSLLAACASAPQGQALYTSANAQTYLVGNELGHGTGVLLNRNCVLTAAHVVDGAKNVQLVDDKRHATQGTRIVQDEDSDIAVVCSDADLRGVPVTVACAMPERYEPVFTIGFPMGYDRVLTTGIYELNALITASAAPGNSGGGVFNQQGQYIGFVDTLTLYPTSNGGALAFPHLIGIIELDKIKSFLQTNKIGYTSCS